MVAMIRHWLPRTTLMTVHAMFFEGQWFRKYPAQKNQSAFTIGTMHTCTLVTVAVKGGVTHGVLWTPGLSWEREDGRTLFVEFPDLDTAEMAMLMGWYPDAEE